jgi:hypothetical protein
VPSTPLRARELGDHYAAACAAYVEWEGAPRWRPRQRARLRARAEELAAIADEYRLPLLDRARGLTAAPLIDVLDAARGRVQSA